LELVERFASSRLGKELKSAKRVEREFGLVIMLEDVVLRGQIDLWFDAGKELVIVDYKTDSVRKPIDEEHLQPYALQLQIYAIALEKITGRKVSRAHLHFLRPNEVIDVDLSPLQLGAALGTIRDFRNAHETLRFPLNEGAHCHRCEFYKGVCPAGRGINQDEGSGTYRLPFSAVALPSAVS
jgi:CRISPR/Cas system-associated exonuclease Cas4 (RecB family)